MQWQINLKTLNLFGEGISFKTPLAWDIQVLVVIYSIQDVRNGHPKCIHLCFFLNHICETNSLAVISHILHTGELPPGHEWTNRGEHAPNE